MVTDNKEQGCLRCLSWRELWLKIMKLLFKQPEATK